MKPRRAERRRAQDRSTLAIAAGGAAILALVSAALLWLVTPTMNDAAAPIGGPFTLTADDGHTVTDRSFPGKYLAVYFGYTQCRDVCPETMNTLTGALAHLGGASARIQPLFITLDPARDSPPVLRRYVAAFSANLIGLTGSPAALRQVRGEYRIVSIAHPETGTLDHSSVIYLMAPDGGFVAPIPADASEMVIARALARYIAPERDIRPANSAL